MKDAEGFNVVHRLFARQTLGCAPASGVNMLHEVLLHLLMLLLRVLHVHAYLLQITRRRQVFEVVVPNEQVRELFTSSQLCLSCRALFHPFVKLQARQVEPPDSHICKFLPSGELVSTPYSIKRTLYTSCLQ